MRSTARASMLFCLVLLVVSGSFAATLEVADWSGLQAAINGATDGDTISLAAGTYESTATITINKAVTVDGNGSTVNVEGAGQNPWRYIFLIHPTGGAGATIQNFTFNKTDKVGQFNMISVQNNDVTIQNNTFTGQFVIGDSDVTRAIETAYNCTGLLIDGNTISGLRQAAYFNPGNTGTVSNNHADSTKGWCVIGAQLNFTDNTWGTNAVDIYLGDGTPFGAPYDPLSAMRAANNDANIEDGRTGVNPYRVTNTTKGTAYTTIQAAIDDADAGDVIDAAAGEYAEAVTIDKALTLQGAGNEATDTVVTVTSGIGINITASNVTIKSLRATGGNSGINVADAANDVEVNSVTCTGNTYGLLVQNVDNLHVTDCNLIGNTSSGAKFRGQTDGLQISGGHFDNNTHGIYHADQPIGHAIQNATIDGTTFNNNTGKGIYTEQMRNTTITNVTIDSSGTGTVWGAGIDINLKLDDYSGIVISDSTIANCGSGDLTNGAGITIKARDDGGYAGSPATLTDVQLTGLTISGCQEGLRFGEPGKLNAGPTNVTVSGCTFTDNVLGDIRQCSKSGVVIDALTDNTFTGATTYGQIEARVWHDFDDATVGHVNFGEYVAPTTVYVDDNFTAEACGGHSWLYDAFATIQPAISRVAAGGTVDVAAGSYAESLQLTKALTLQGPNAAINPNTGVRVDEAVITGNMQKLSDDVSILGFEFQSPSTAIAQNATNGAANLNVAYNRFIGCDIVFYDAENLYTNLAISNNYIEGGSVPFFLGNVTGGSIAENTFKNIGIFPICLGGNTQVSAFAISDNTVDGSATYAFQLAGTCSDITISGNTITNTGTGQHIEKSGICLSSSSLTDVSITGNEITKSHRALSVRAGATIADTEITVTGNTFGADNDMAIRHGGTGTLTVTGNTFTGATTDQDIEDKVWHDVDDATVGHVDWGQGAATECGLVVSPVTGAVGDTLQLTAKLTVDGTGLSGQTVSFQVDGADAGSGTTDATGVAVTAYTIGEGDNTITATFAGVSNYIAVTAENTLTANAAKATGITLALDADEVTSGDVITCTVTGDNGEDYTAEATYYVERAAAGAWENNAYTTAKAGDWTVTAVCNTLTATAALTVNVGPAVGVTVTPAEATINAGESQEYAVEAIDAAGNTWSPEGALASDGAGTFEGNTYTADAGDAGAIVTITATVEEQTAEATLNVNAAAGPGLILAWDKDDQTFYLCSNATDPADGGVEVTDGMTLTVAGVEIPVTVSGGGSDVTVTVGTSSLRVQWTVRRGSLLRATQYSTIDGVTQTASYDGRRTLLDGMWQTGFWGLTHTINADSVEYGSALQ